MQILVVDCLDRVPEENRWNPAGSVFVQTEEGMAHRPVNRLDDKQELRLILRFGIVAALAIPVVPVQAQANTAGRPAFEVASVKPATEPDTPHGAFLTIGIFISPGRVEGKFVTLRMLIRRAYSVKDYQIEAADWMNTERYALTATMSPNTSKDQVPLMLQTLLADRFKLVLHHEMKERPVYALVVAKHGPKLKKAETQTGVNAGGGVVSGRTTLASLADSLSAQTGRPVLDQTGLAGIYDIDLHWTPGLIADPVDAPGQSLFTVIQNQLGLKLEARKAPVDVLVIDHAERVPTEN